MTNTNGQLQAFGKLESLALAYELPYRGNSCLTTEIASASIVNGAEKISHRRSEGDI